jgi:preprotein translocase subunit SecY
MTTAAAPGSRAGGFGQSLTALINAFRIPDLRTKMLFTLGLLGLYRVGAFIPTPGVDVGALRAFFAEQAAGLFGLVNLFSGGNFEQFSIFALGVMPYITASIIMQLLVSVIPKLEQMQKEESGRKQIQQWTRISAISLGSVQGFFMAMTLLESNPDFLKIGWEPGWFFRISVVITQMAGIAIVMWLGERITERGVGNGISLIIFAGIIASFPGGILDTITQVSVGQISLLAAIAFFAAMILAVAGIVFIQQGERRIPAQYARKVVGRKVYGGQSTYIPLKVNAAGVLPIIFAVAILQIPAFIASAFPGSPVMQQVGLFFAFNSPTGIAMQLILIVLFTYFYTQIQFNPKQIADNLREYGGFIPGIRPGQPTSEFLEHTTSRITLWGALFLGSVAIFPNIVQNITNVATFQFSGTGLLIVVGVALDTIRQVESQLLVRHYEGFMRKGRIRGRGRGM